MFDNTPPQITPEGVKAAQTFNELVQKIKAEMEKWANPLSKTLDTMVRLQESADVLNKSVIGNREQISQFARAIADASPGIRGLGGEFKEVGETIQGIAAGTRRNVVASTKDIQELFSAAELSDKKVNEIVDAFGKVGIQYSDIGEKLTSSINYINTLGVNTKSVLGTVVANTDKLSRFNFEQGVQGLSKMAAQASMMRFDMAETFKLADDVLDPERAIEVASAFQRLGVNAGSLVDPFQLMNQSINDPSGLQDSLINIGKQFTYFDEKAGQFKINPQGLLTLREIGKQTGISAEKLREAALTAADFDKRLSAIGNVPLFAGATEDDKKLIANMARIGKEKGTYEVQVKNEQTGLLEYKKLSEVSAKQYQELIEQQKKGPQTIEEIQKDQLSLTESSVANLGEINEKMSMLLVANDKTLQGSLTITKAIRESTKGAAAIGVRPDTKRQIEDLQDRLSKETDPKVRQELFKQLGETISTNLGATRAKMIQEIADTESKTGTVSLEKVADAIQIATRGLFPGQTPRTGGRTTPSTGKTGAGSGGASEEFLEGTRDRTARADRTAALTRTAAIERVINVNPISGDINLNIKTDKSDLNGKELLKLLGEAPLQLKQKLFEIVDEQAKAVGVDLKK